MRYFLSFVEEAVMNPKYVDYIGGRVEVYRPDEQYAFREIRFFTKQIKGYDRFRKRWDMQTVFGWQLKRIERKIRRKFYDTYIEDKP